MSQLRRVIQEAINNDEELKNKVYTLAISGKEGLLQAITLIDSMGWTREELPWLNITTINAALEDSLSEISEFSAGQERIWKDTAEGTSSMLLYQFMSSWGGHDDEWWNESTQGAREVVLDNLVELGATIEGEIPPMNDFGTPGVNFSLGGQLFQLITTGRRYDVQIYAKEIGQ